MGCGMLDFIFCRYTKVLFFYPYYKSKDENDYYELIQLRIW